MNPATMFIQDSQLTKINVTGMEELEVKSLADKFWKRRPDAEIWIVVMSNANVETDKKKVI